MSVYAKQIAQALRMIKAKGQVVTWRRTNLTQSGLQPWKSDAGANADNSVSILFLKPKGGLASLLVSLIKGSDVPRTSLRGLMGAVSFVPDMSDIVIRNGVTLTIKGFDAIAPNGETIMYDLEFN